MAQFEVTAVNEKGKNVKIFIEADSSRSARAKVRSQKMTPLSIKTASAASIKEESIGQQIKNPLGGIKPAELSNIIRQFASLIKSNVPIVESLTALIEQSEKAKMRKMLASVRQSVKDGNSLSDSFSQFPKVFDRVFVNMVSAGESSGQLDVVLLKVADFNEDQIKFKTKVTGALMYPIILVIVAILVLIGIFIFVVPQLSVIFENTDKMLPLPTRILIKCSDLARDYIFYAVVIFLIAGIALERYVKTKKGRYRKDKFMIRAPLLGRLMKNIVVARITRTLGTMLKSGVSMINALEITKNVSNNAIYEEILEECKTMVSEGRSLAYSLKQSNEFPPMVTHMTAVGEKTGELEDMLANVADNFETQVDTSLNSITSLLSPVMILFMAAMVGFIVASVLMPIMEMNQF